MTKVNSNNSGVIIFRKHRDQKRLRILIIGIKIQKILNILYENLYKEKNFDPFKYLLCKIIEGL